MKKNAKKDSSKVMEQLPKTEAFAKKAAVLLRKAQAPLISYLRGDGDCVNDMDVENILEDINLLLAPTGGTNGGYPILVYIDGGLFKEYRSLHDAEDDIIEAVVNNGLEVTDIVDTETNKHFSCYWRVKLEEI